MPIYDDEKDADKIIDNKWIGNHRSSTNRSFLKKHNIKRILNVTKDYKNSFYGIEYYRIPASSHNDLTDINIVYEIYDFINKGDVLIHCKNGHRRSAIIMAMYMIIRYNNPKNLVIECITHKRHRTFPKTTNTEILDKLERVLFDNNTNPTVLDKLVTR